MAQPSDKLAESLALLKALQDAGHIAIRATSMSRTHRERLVKNGFIREVMRGWYIASRPEEPPRREHGVVCRILGILRGVPDGKVRDRVVP
jgi:hypothetical protein